MLNGTSPEAATIPVNSDEPNTSAMKKDSAKKYPATMTTLPITQPNSTLRLNRLSEIRPAARPSNPLLTNAKGPNVGNPTASDSEEPTAPEMPPITGPTANAKAKIIISPQLK